MMNLIKFLTEKCGEGAGFEADVVKFLGLLGF